MLVRWHQNFQVWKLAHVANRVVHYEIDSGRLEKAAFEVLILHSELYVEAIRVGAGMVAWVEILQGSLHARGRQIG